MAFGKIAAGTDALNARFTILQNLSTLLSILMYIAFDDECCDSEKIVNFYSFFLGVNVYNQFLLFLKILTPRSMSENIFAVFNVVSINETNVPNETTIM